MEEARTLRRYCTGQQLYEASGRHLSSYSARSLLALSHFVLLLCIRVLATLIILVQWCPFDATSMQSCHIFVVFSHQEAKLTRIVQTEFPRYYCLNKLVFLVCSKQGLLLSQLLPSIHHLRQQPNFLLVGKALSWWWSQSPRQLLYVLTQRLTGTTEAEEDGVWTAVVLINGLRKGDADWVNMCVVLCS